MNENNEELSAEEAKELRELGARGGELRKQVEQAREKYLQTRCKKDYERYKRAISRRTQFIRQNLPEGVSLPPLMASLLLNMAEKEK
ncbi:hypothetical protein [Desmospora activa]|uniref:Uncharacterized protein n=1 Tax=Desmospora activa DSM 45169 TaxID=1121389 RepID=A0A2T4Z7M7_9BACL|nr:hypothetical protein [Desmospora activa]PTM57898.1 hypothetical protein C8J48_0463 [Desmospora activa DSM 45169]